VYDFRHPEPGNNGFSWRVVDPNWQNWTPDAYLAGLESAEAEHGFNLDMNALRAADVCVYVMPCGVSASLEAGWAAGAGKRVAVYVPGLREPDLMVKIADLITNDLVKLCNWVRDVKPRETAHAQEVAQLRRERDELRRAIHSTADESWQHSAYVALAEAHRVDSDTVDEWEDSDEPRKTRAEAQVSQLTARLRELRELWIQGIVYPSDAMARAFQYRNDGRILCVDCDQPIHDPHATGCRVGRFTQLIVGATDGLPSPPVP
jgi:hypothetical protein